MIFKNISNGKIVQLKASSEMIFFLELWKTVGKDLNRTSLLQGMNARKKEGNQNRLYFLTIAGFEALGVFNSFLLTQTVKLSYEAL